MLHCRVSAELSGDRRHTSPSEEDQRQTSARSSSIGVGAHISNASNPIDFGAEPVFLNPSLTKVAHRRVATRMSRLGI